MCVFLHSCCQPVDPRCATFGPGQWDHANSEQEEEGGCAGSPDPQGGPLPPFLLPLLPLCCAGCWSEGLSPGWADTVGEIKSCEAIAWTCCPCLVFKSVCLMQSWIMKRVKRAKGAAGDLKNSGYSSKTHSITKSVFCNMVFPQKTTWSSSSTFIKKLGYTNIVHLFMY